MRRIAFALALAVIGGVRGAHAQDAGFAAVVPDDYPTIQAAIDAAPNLGNVDIAVRAGEYAESLRVAGHTRLVIAGEPGVRVVSRGGAAAVDVSGGGVLVLRQLDLTSEGHGVHVRDVHSTTLDRVTIHDTPGHGFLAEGVGADVGDISLGGCDIDGAGGDGIRILAVRHDVSVAESSIVNAGGDGVHVDAATAHVWVTGVRITGPIGSGVRVNATGTQGDIDVTGCFLQAVGADGIRVDGRVAEGYVNSTRIFGAGGAGILCGPGARLERVDVCEVRGTGSDGIRVDADSVRFNVVTDTGGEGISVTGHPWFVSDNEVSRTGGDGIRVKSLSKGTPTGMILNNVVTGCAGHGINLLGSRWLRVQKNVVEGALGAGFRLGAGASRNELEENRAVDCRHGLRVSRRAGRNRIRRDNRFDERTEED